VSAALGRALHVIRGNVLKTLKAVGALALLALAFPAAALAHSGSATVSCTAADFDFYNFAAGSNTVHYAVKVDNVPVAGGDFALNQAGGTKGTLHVPLAVYGVHTVTAYAWWGPIGTVFGHTGGSATVPMAVGNVSCAAAPAPPSPPAPAAAAPAPAAAVPVTTPASGVLGEQVASPARIARLAASRSCTSRRVGVTVAGQAMRRITFRVNGRVVRTVNVRAGQRSVRASVPMTSRRAAQVVTARVTFRNGARPRTLVARTARCAQAAVQPQFTG
jgi:hypothetical protein